MSDYTPSTGEVRRRYAYARSDKPQHKNQSAVAEFDRWLAAHDAEKRAEWEAEQDNGEPDASSVRRGAKAILDAAEVRQEHRTEEMWSLAERDASAVIESLDVEHAVLWDEGRRAPGAFNRRVTPWVPVEQEDET